MENIYSFGYGAISGMCGLLISHPFDTIKTHIQTNQKMTYKLSHLYRGLTPPLIGVGIEKAIVFGSFNLAQKYVDSVFISGCFSGLSASLIVSPYERLKILFQQGSNKFVALNNLNLKFLYKGLSATFSREVPGFGIYFTVFEKTKKNIFDNKMSTIQSFVLGGLSGAIAWVFIYPQDMIKTRVQSSLTNSGSFLKTFNEIHKTYGIKHFYKGFHLALMRAVPLHAGTFCTMELLKNNHYKNTKK